MSQKITFGDWLKNTRIERGFSQQDLVDNSNGLLKQSTISSYESNKVKEISVGKLIYISHALGIKPKDIPWEKFEFSTEDPERLSMYELPSTADSVKLFNGKLYQLEGFVGRELKTGEVKPVSEIYYQVRSAAVNGVVCAKRKRPKDELRKIII